MQKQVKILNLKADKFGVFKAVELDFSKFKDGVLAIKGNAGQGKSTIQKALKLSTAGRKTLDDASQYGDQWVTETQLLDGERKIFVGAYKKVGSESIEFKLFEKDAEGKKTFTPVIDGLKATPAAYMDLISTELTFGIKDFLHENNTVHKKFMFALFRPELEKLGVIFDKKNASYDASILGQLDQLTAERDALRNKCTHMGAFATDFKRDGLELDDIELYERVNTQELSNKHTQLLIDKGQSSGNANAEFEKKRAAVQAKGSTITEQIREKAQILTDQYAKSKAYFDKVNTIVNEQEQKHNEIVDLIRPVEFLRPDKKKEIITELLNAFDSYSLENNPKEPIKPICPAFDNGKLIIAEAIVYQPDFLPLIEQFKSIATEYMAIVPEPTNEAEIEAQIAKISADIESATARNLLIDRYEVNREWVAADAQVTIKRKELAQLYAKVNTGVEGLRMKPFFDDDKGTSDIKTVYTGCYDYRFFKPKTKKMANVINCCESQDRENAEILLQNEQEREQLLISFSSTQRPIIGVLLQVARLKLKEKALPYIFIDDVPMDMASRAILTDMAEKNGLTIITSITGDFDKDKLTENELLIEGGEVFFN